MTLSQTRDLIWCVAGTVAVLGMAAVFDQASTQNADRRAFMETCRTVSTAAACGAVWYAMGERR